jgi:hypothetical protein
VGRVGSSLTPHRLLASSKMLSVVVVDAALLSAIMGRVSLFSLRTNGSVLGVPETLPLPPHEEGA